MLPNIIIMTKMERLDCAGRVSHTLEGQFWWESKKDRSHCEYLELGGRILGWILE
jgi:hypothetical protein